MTDVGKLFDELFIGQRPGRNIPVSTAWLDRAKAKRAAHAEALRDAAKAARTMYDPPTVECLEWATWLDARANRIEDKA